MLLAPGAFACQLIVTGIYKRLPFVAQEEKESYIKEFGARYLTYPSRRYQTRNFQVVVPPRIPVQSVSATGPTDG